MDANGHNSTGAKVSALSLAVVWAAFTVAMISCDSKDAEKVNLDKKVDKTELAEMAPKRDSSIVRFGFDLRAAPEEDAKQYLPFLKYLEKETDLRFELRFTPKGGAVADDLGKGVIQLAAVGADTYIAAHAKYDVIPLVRGLNSQGRAEYQSVIIVAPDSPIQKIEELRGKRFAFGGITSTQGYLIPRIILASRGMLLNDLGGHEYTGSHRNCANAVAAGRFDAGGMQDVMGRQMAEQGLIRIIHTSQFYPSSGIAASKNVPPETIEKIKRALVNFKPKGKDAKGLYHWDRTEMPNGFTEAHDDDYAELRQWSIKFRLINTPTTSKSQ